jgi:hypothetical protein
MDMLHYPEDDWNDDDERSPEITMKISPSSDRFDDGMN